MKVSALLLVAFSIFSNASFAGSAQCDLPSSLLPTTATEAVLEKTISNTVNVGEALVVIKTAQTKSTVTAQSEHIFTNFSPLAPNLHMPKGQKYEVIATYGNTSNRIYAINISQKFVKAVALINSNGDLCDKVFTVNMDGAVTPSYGYELKVDAEALPFLVENKATSNSSQTSSLILAEADVASLKFLKVRSTNGRVVQKNPVVLDAFEKQFNVSGFIFSMKKSAAGFDVKVIEEPRDWLQWRNGV